MKKYIWQIVLFLILVIIMASCTTMKTGYYTVKEIRGLSTVVLKEVQGDWHIPNSDTLKVGQKIYLTRTKVDSLINVW